MAADLGHSLFCMDPTHVPIGLKQPMEPLGANDTSSPDGLYKIAALHEEGHLKSATTAGDEPEGGNRPYRR